jgi:hypothetical protein
MNFLALTWLITLQLLIEKRRTPFARLSALKLAPGQRSAA